MFKLSVSIVALKNMFFKRKAILYIFMDPYSVLMVK
jgi:hypothetical protein